MIDNPLAGGGITVTLSARQPWSTRCGLLALLTAILLCSPALAGPWAQKMFADVRHDFGTIARGAKAEFEFSLKNIYVEDVRITGVRVRCGCTSVWIKDDKRVLKTYETATIVAHINSATFLGSKGATITVTFDKPLRGQAQLQVNAYIRKDVVLQPSSVQFRGHKPILEHWERFGRSPAWLDWRDWWFRGCRITSRSVETAGSRRFFATRTMRPAWN